VTYDTFILNIRRGETPFYARLRQLAKAAEKVTLPLPRSMHPLLRFLYHLHWFTAATIRSAVSYVYFEPLFRGRCASVGRRFFLRRLPFVVGHATIRIGDDVTFYGQVHVFSGRIFDAPALTLKDGVQIGHNVLFVVNREILVEENVKIASDVRFMDSDAHPKAPAERSADLPPRPESVKPIRVGRDAWIGQNAFIMKGVTIGEAAIVGVNSVVVSDVPPYSIVMGNPARVISRVGR
jgi:acetyltransferase-like isoleucine patch superfamily enzyme